MICEYCPEDHDGSYGSGRFCSAFCARGFTTLAKRAEINAKVSATLKGRPPANSFKPGFDPRRYEMTDECRAKAVVAKGLINAADWDRVKSEIERDGLVTKHSLRKFWIEAGEFCRQCDLTEWRGGPICFELHHLDGNSKNHRRSNTTLLCPNCHSQTHNYKGRNRPAVYASGEAASLSMT